MTKLHVLPPYAPRRLVVVDDLGPDPKHYAPAADGASLAQAARADGADRLQTNLENRAQLLGERARGVSHPRPKGSMVVTEVGTVRRKGRRTRVPRRVWVSDRAGEATREPTAAERRRAMLRVQPPVLTPRIKRNMAERW